MENNGDSLTVGLELFGQDGILLPIAKGQKGPRLAGWQKLTLEASRHPRHQALLAGATNIGVLLGPASGHLVDIDCDTDLAVQQFLEANLALCSATVQTVGRRGRHFFFRMRGPYPQRICRFEPAGEPHIGEWRGGGGAQTVVAGVHPSGCLYRVIHGGPVLEIDFSQLRWPLGWIVPTESPPEEQAVQELAARLELGLISSRELSRLEVPVRPSMVGSWCKQGDLGFIFGERGSGKTWLVGSIACYAARGVALFDWVIDRPWNVLWIDGEMPLSDFKDRLVGMLEAPLENLLVIHHERFFDLGLGSLNLAETATQRALILVCRNTNSHLLILDNLSCLFSGMLENDAEEWEKVQPWLLELRRMGVTVIIVHHASRSGQMRGHSKREDNAAWIIKVEAIVGRKPQELEQAHFSSTFTKQRNGSLQITRDWDFQTTPDGVIQIGCEEKDFDEKVYELIKLEIDSCTEIAKELGCSNATVSKAAARLIKQKLITKKGRHYKATYVPGDE